MRPGTINPDKPVSRYQRRTLSVLAEGGWLERKKKMRRLARNGYDRDPDRMSFDLYTEQGTRIKRVDLPAIAWLREQGYLGPDLAITEAGREVVENTDRWGDWR